MSTTFGRRSRVRSHRSYMRLRLLFDQAVREGSSLDAKFENFANVAGSRLLRRLAKCSYSVPRDVSEMLAIPTFSSYAVATKDLAGWLDRQRLSSPVAD